MSFTGLSDKGSKRRSCEKGILAEVFQQVSGHMIRWCFSFLIIFRRISISVQTPDLPRHPEDERSRSLTKKMRTMITTESWTICCSSLTTRTENKPDWDSSANVLVKDLSLRQRTGNQSEYSKYSSFICSVTYASHLDLSVNSSILALLLSTIVLTDPKEPLGTPLGPFFIPCRFWGKIAKIINWRTPL